MKTLRAFVVLILLPLISFNANAQIKRSYAMSDPSFLIFNKDVSKFKIIDSSYLNLIYDMSFKAYQNDTSLSSKDRMCLQIGKNYSKFFSKNMNQNDSLCTELLKTQLRFPLNKTSWQGYEIYNRLKDNYLTVTNRVPYTQTVLRYKENNFKINWDLENETKTIMGYECLKARCEVSGRKYIAWYTLDIPINLGPWKFGGLPGLILQIYDTNNEYKFECVGLTQNSQKIVEYDWKYKETSKKDCMSFLKDMYDNAGKFVLSTGERVIIMDNSSKGFHTLNQDWKEYYNPIELK